MHENCFAPKYYSIIIQSVQNSQSKQPPKFEHYIYDIILFKKKSISAYVIHLYGLTGNLNVKWEA